MLAGRPPFRAADETVLVVQHLRQAPPALSVLRPDLSPALSGIVERALAKEPAARYRNAGQLAQILRSQVAQPGGDVESLSASVQLRVPPPTPGQAIARSGEPAADEFDRGVDWVMIALIIAALLAMFGLVKLWRTVYEQYTAPAACVPPAEWRGVTSPCWICVEDCQDGYLHSAGPSSCSLPTLYPSDAMRAKELVDPAVIWYNISAAQCVHQRAVRELLLDYGVKITGLAASLC
jgi:hypothetical protein